MAATPGVTGAKKQPQAPKPVEPPCDLGMLLASAVSNKSFADFEAQPYWYNRHGSAQSAEAAIGRVQGEQTRIKGELVAYRAYLAQVRSSLTPAERGQLDQAKATPPTSPKVAELFHQHQVVDQIAGLVTAEVRPPELRPKPPGWKPPAEAPVAEPAQGNWLKKAASRFGW